MRFFQRSIDIDHVKRAIAEPDVCTNAFEGKLKAMKKLEDGRQIVVIYFKDRFKDSKNSYIVVTAYYLND
jgi:hypothetical protein